VKQVRKAMWGWCLKGDKRRAILSNSPLDTNVETNECKLGIKAFNQMKASSTNLHANPAIKNRHYR